MLSWTTNTILRRFSEEVPNPHICISFLGYTECFVSTFFHLCGQVAFFWLHLEPRVATHVISSILGPHRMFWCLHRQTVKCIVQFFVGYVALNTLDKISLLHIWTVADHARRTERSFFTRTYLQVVISTETRPNLRKSCLVMLAHSTTALVLYLTCKITNPWFITRTEIKWLRHGPSWLKNGRILVIFQFWLFFELWSISHCVCHFTF